MDHRDCWQGLRVMWTHVPRGGYGFSLLIPARVVRVANRRVVIEIEREPRREVTVSAEKLTPWDRYIEHRMSATTRRG